MTKKTGKQPSATTAKRRSKRSPASAASQSRPGPRRLFEVRRSGIHGRGGYALEDIPKGARIAEYTGEILTWDQVFERYPEEDERNGQNHTFLFEIDDDHVIDANVRGNASRWINHSCAPNCEAKGEGDKVFIHAIRRIRAGDELVYDYNIQLPERHTPALKRRYQCLCGARTCRGTILGKKR